MYVTKPIADGEEQIIEIPEEFRYNDNEELVIRKQGSTLMIMPLNEYIQTGGNPFIYQVIHQWE